MIIEPTISYGAIATIFISVATFFGVIVLYFFKSDKQADKLSMKLDVLAMQVDKQGASITGVERALLVQIENTTRIAQLEKLVDELRHGQGYALPLDYADKMERAEIASRKPRGG